MNIKGKILFEEQQQFRVTWIWVLIFLSVLSSVGITVGAIIAEEQKQQELWWVLGFVILFESALLYIFYITRFETVISTEGIYYKWWPFQRKGWFIPRDEITQIEIRKAPSMSYGYHWVRGFGKVHNLGPGKGLGLVLRNGKKLFLGTKRESLLETALNKLNLLPVKPKLKNL